MGLLGPSRNFLTSFNVCAPRVLRASYCIHRGQFNRQFLLAPTGTSNCITQQNNILKKPSLWFSTSNNFFAKDAIDTGSKEHIKNLVNKSKVVLFMKGIPEEPRCGFSNAVVQILRMHDVKYDSYDVLEDDKLRSGIKEYSDWPTIPQIYFDGEFVGGCDILLQMHQSGDLIDELKKIGIRSALLDKK